MAEKFKLTIVTPDREFFNEEAEMVEFNTTEGEIGVYAGHAPLTVIVKPGILTITQGETVRNAALHAGFVQILPEEITILAEIIEWPQEIDAKRAEAAKQRAEGRIAERNANIDLDRAQAALMRAIARINAAGLK
ncbi:MAG: ATP synthase F1 subunit epsilon [Lachnospiraceae bacterium]|jgi:ATP synthase, F1 epsilon subunit (delta in mitochondria)|nr:ATP synthase F1 subunit epsilon [Lachnospiraceae bacterium]